MFLRDERINFEIKETKKKFKFGGPQIKVTQN